MPLLSKTSLHYLLMPFLVALSLFTLAACYFNPQLLPGMNAGRSDIETLVQRIGGEDVLDKSSTPAIEDYMFMGSLAHNRNDYLVVARVAIAHCSAAKHCMSPLLAAINVELLESKPPTVLRRYLDRHWSQPNSYENGCPIMHEISNMVEIAHRVENLRNAGEHAEAEALLVHETDAVVTRGGIYSDLSTSACRTLFVSKPYLAQAYLNHAAELFMKLECCSEGEWLRLYNRPTIARVREALLSPDGSPILAP